MITALVTCLSPFKTSKSTFALSPRKSIMRFLVVLVYVLYILIRQAAATYRFRPVKLVCWKWFEQFSRSFQCTHIYAALVSKVITGDFTVDLKRKAVKHQQVGVHVLRNIL